MEEVNNYLKSKAIHTYIYCANYLIRIKIIENKKKT